MFYQWWLWGAFRRKYKVGPLQEEGPGSWTALLIWSSKWQMETSFYCHGFCLRIYHEAMPAQPSILPSDHPPPSRRPCLNLVAEILPTWAPNRDMHWWKDREAGIQSRSLARAANFPPWVAQVYSSHSGQEGHRGSACSLFGSWGWLGPPSHRPCTVFLPESCADCRRQNPFVNTVCSKRIV